MDLGLLFKERIANINILFWAFAVSMISDVFLFFKGFLVFANQPTVHNWGVDSGRDM